uniref:Butyrophilin like 8 n=1 Tax=Otolemur garnettii TaxID=30611 RepID=H0WWE8_OTOGA
MVLVLALALSLLKLGSGQWQVIGPNKPVQALVGEDVVFSCFLSPETNAEAMEVRIFRDQFSAIIHLYQDGKDQDYMQKPSYRGRTELMKDFIADGHVSLRLKKVTALDAGLYGCWFSSQTYDQGTTWELQVSEMGSAPLISLTGFVDGGIRLLCQSSGWFSQPTVKWKGPQGHDIPSDSKVNVDRHGLFDVETSLTLQENLGSISCSVQLTDQSPEVTSSIWLGEMFFQRSPWLLAFISLTPLCIGISVGIIGMKILFSKSQGKIQKKLEWRKKHRQADLKEVRKYAVEVTLDPDTAHPQLHVADLKTVCYTNVPQEVPHSEKRFTRMCVVASQGFQAGKHYWEVGVRHNKRWHLGVCRDDVDRTRNNVILSPDNGYWVLGLEMDWHFTLNPHRINLSLRNTLLQVGVFLDYEGGTISFFNINDQSPIYTMTHRFEGLLRPYIQHEAYEDENVTPIVICPV